MVFIELIFKIFQETIINPLYKTLGTTCNSEENTSYYAKKLLLFCSIACIVFSLIIFFLVEPIMRFSKIPDSIFDSTKVFLQIMVFANGVGIVVQYLFTFNLINKNSRGVFIYFLMSSLGTLLLGVLLIPKFTLGLGTVGLAISILVVNVGQMAYFFATMPKVEKTAIAQFDRKKYAKLCSLSFVESLTRNLTYYFVVLVLINTLNNQDLYYIGNEFIWSIMLVPALAQNSYIKQNVARCNTEKLKPYFLHNIVICMFICLMIPVALLVFKYVFAFENYMGYFLTLIKLVPCYFIFIFDNVIESYFIATGKMNHVFMQTLITNILVYVTSFLLYEFGIWNVTLNTIILVFSAGMILSSVYTISVYIYFLKRQKINS